MGCRTRWANSRNSRSVSSPVTIRSKRPADLVFAGTEALYTTVPVSRRSRRANDANVISGVFGVIITGLPTSASFPPFKRVTSAFSQIMSMSSLSFTVGTKVRARVSKVAPSPRMGKHSWRALRALIALIVAPVVE